MAKVMVSLPDDVLRSLDVAARRRGTTRSGLLRSLAEDAARSRSRQRASRMAEIARDADPAPRRGGRAAELVKENRPDR
ncbi:MAG: type II toxin-antitoxin system HicB family antitoxin [Bifidobacteriaceae bacterium]|jgi:metal-responsive CopG/Arc/MetJ family transcriptional regulator|nr:type II toxin-antitoxin system HicB family antitoxin [Bifidobacteriaceae bacterium]